MDLLADIVAWVIAAVLSFVFVYLPMIVGRKDR